MSVIALRKDNKTYIACDSLVDEYNFKYGRYHCYEDGNDY